MSNGRGRGRPPTTAKILCDSAAEAQQIEEGMKDPAVRAFVRVAAALAALPTRQERLRVLRYAEEQAEVQCSQAKPKGTT